MTESHPEKPASTPPAVQVAVQSLPETGSLAAGIGLAWLIMIVGVILAIVIAQISIKDSSSALIGGAIAGFILSPLVIIVWGAILIGRKSRTGKGMFFGLLSIAAVLLLLIAACFGLVSR